MSAGNWIDGLVKSQRLLANSSDHAAHEFRLQEEFLQPYEIKDPGFGFSGLGEMVYNKNYSRVTPQVRTLHTPSFTTSLTSILGKEGTVV